MSISIIIPVYNEEASIERCLAETHRAFTDVDYEMIAVNDGSTDRSDALIRTCLLQHTHMKYVAYKSNKGYSHAIRQGIEEATKQYTAYLDADLQYPPRELRAMYEFALNDHHAFVLGEPTNKYYQFGRRIMSYVYNFLVAHLLDVQVKDANSLKVTDTRILKGLDLKREFGGIELEILLGMRSQSIPIVVFPISVEERIAGHSKANLNVILSTIYNILDLRRARKSAHDKAPATGFR